MTDDDRYLVLVFGILLTILVFVDGWMGVVEFLIAIGIAIAAYVILW